MSAAAFSPSSQDGAVSVVPLKKRGTFRDLPVVPTGQPTVWFEVRAGLVRSVRLRPAGALATEVACGVARDPQAGNADHALVGATAPVTRSQILKRLSRTLAEAATQVA